MKRLVAMLALAALLSCTGRPGPTPIAPQRIAITNVTLIDVRAASADRARLPGQTVLIEGDRITAVGPARNVAIPAGARRVDGRGRFLAPGLWDAHVHLSTFGDAALPLLVAEGVTAVRDMGGDPARLGAWRDEVRAGRRTGPQIFFAGRNMEGAWWLDRVAQAARTDPILSTFSFLEVSPRERLASAADADRALSGIAAGGVDLIKFRNLRPDEFRAVAAEARRRGLILAGHSPRSTPPGQAAEAGMASIEHMETVTLALGDLPERDRLREFGRIAAARTAITATLITDVAYRQTPDAQAYGIIADASNKLEPRRRYLSRMALAAWRFGLDAKKMEAGDTTDYPALHRRQLADLRLARQAGVPILVGSDLTVSLIYPGSSVHEEMRYLVEKGGLTPLEALQAATINPARAMRLPAQGFIAPGARPDLILLDRDPTVSTPDGAAIGAVLLNGRLLARPDLARLREESARLASAGVRQ